MKKTLPTTEKITQLFNCVTYTEELMGKLTSRLYFGKPTIKEMTEFIEYLSSVRTRLWMEVYKVYPETIGTDVSLRLNRIEYTIKTDEN